jgi:putative DNA methylase
MSEPYRKKLIEVALPLEAINRESAREKSIRHGHPSTLHLWWARRPLAACRAVLFASIVDDPSSRPDLFPTEEEQEVERQRLFRIIEELVKWENMTNETVLEAAREEIRNATDGNPPPVLDPFCGGGSIPLEAQRLGLEANASDLNPVAVLITKALIEIPPKFAGKPPVNPAAREKLAHRATWKGAQGLAEDVRYYGRWMRDRAFERIGHLYPKAQLPDGGEATVIAWLWARTVTCPNPACGAVMPLLNGLTLSRRRGNEAWLDPQPNPDRGRVAFEIRLETGTPPDGTVGRRGARCLTCGEAAPLAYVRGEGKAGRMGAQMLAIVAEGDRRRLYLGADAEHEASARDVEPTWAPDTDIVYEPRAITAPNYGFAKHCDLFTSRQLVALATFSDLVLDARDQTLRDGADPEYAHAIATCLTLGIGKLANRCSSQCFWDPGPGNVQQVFARNALPMIWVFAEANPFSESSGNFVGQIEYLANALDTTPARGQGVVEQIDAMELGEASSALVITDPPYYDNVPYADLSDFFYVWLRHAGHSLYATLFSTVLVPKTQELVAEPARHGGWDAAAHFFETGLRTVFERLRIRAVDGFPLVVMYAFKQAEETVGQDGHVSTGWERMLEGLLASGLSITGTWPIRTEQPGGLREHGRNSLASSIALACRPKAIDAGLATRREFITALREELPASLKQLQHGNIAPVDLAQAAIGPGMAVFSRYAKVLEADGSPMTVRSALALVNQTLDELLAEQESDFDPDTRFAVTWFEQRGFQEGPFGEADVLARAKDTSAGGLEEAGVLFLRAGKVRLLRRDELPEDWDPVADRRPTVWEATQHLVRRLEMGGEEAAAELLRRLGGFGETARELAYRLYTTCDRKGWAQDALAYNALVVAWPEIARLVVGTPEAEAQQSLEI